MHVTPRHPRIILVHVSHTSSQTGFDPIFSTFLAKDRRLCRGSVASGSNAVTTVSDMATASIQDLPIVQPAHLKNLDPPMVVAPYPAGFPMREDSPRLLSEFNVSERSIRQVLLLGGHEWEACIEIPGGPHYEQMELS